MEPIEVDVEVVDFSDIEPLESLSLPYSQLHSQGSMEALAVSTVAYASNGIFDSCCARRDFTGPPGFDPPSSR